MSGLSRKLGVKRENLSMERALDDSNIIDLGTDIMMLPESVDIVDVSTVKALELFEDETVDLDKKILVNKLRNEYIIQETLNKISSLAMDTNDPEYFKLLKGFIELSLKNDESISKLKDIKEPSISEVSGNENVYIQNNTFSGDIDPSKVMRNTSDILDQYGESHAEDQL